MIIIFNNMVYFTTQNLWWDVTVLPASLAGNNKTQSSRSPFVTSQGTNDTSSATITSGGLFFCSVSKKEMIFHWQRRTGISPKLTANQWVPLW